MHQDWSVASLSALDGSRDYLFDMPLSLSPKRRWLERHFLHTRKRDDGKWECVLDEQNKAVGEDEETAIVAFCIKHSCQHYSMDT